MPTTIRTDDFNRANGVVGGTYTAINGGPDLFIVSNEVQSNNSQDAWMFDNLNSYDADQYSQMRVKSVTGGRHDLQPVVRGSSNTFYSCYHRSSDGAIVTSKMFGGTYDEVGSAAAYGTSVVGEVWRIEVSGTVTPEIRVYVDGVLKSTVTDSTNVVTAGKAGPGHYANNNFSDDWEGGNLGGGGGGGSAAGAAHRYYQMIGVQ